MASHVRDQYNLRRWGALMLGVGTPEFINQCKAEFDIGQEMVGRRRDSDVSRSNLEALRNGSLNFIITGSN